MHAPAAHAVGSLEGADRGLQRGAGEQAVGGVDAAAAASHDHNIALRERDDYERLARVHAYAYVEQKVQTSTPTIGATPTFLGITVSAPSISPDSTGIR